MKGSDFAKNMVAGYGDKAEAARAISPIALKTMLGGNMPAFGAGRVGCTTSAVIDGSFYELLYFVSPTYLAIGEDSDFVTWPLSIVDLQAYCDAHQVQYKDTNRTGPAYFIPPKKIIKRTWEWTTHKIVPQAMWQSDIGNYGGIGGVKLIPAQQTMINGALAKWNGPDGKGQGASLSTFVRHKKAYCTVPKMGTGNLRFEGWYWPGNALKTGWVGDNPMTGKKGHEVDTGKYGDGFQHGDTGGHDAGYCDYSHGCDLVHYDAYINGMMVPFDDVCMDPKFNVLVSDQGPFNPTFPNDGKPLSKPMNAAPPPLIPPASYKGDRFITVSNDDTKLIQPASAVYYRPIEADNPESVEDSNRFPWGPLLVGGAALALFWGTLKMRSRTA